MRAVREGEAHLGEGEGGESARVILDGADAFGRTVHFEERAVAVILADQASTVGAWRSP